jgi:hypothetical protein
MTDLPTSAPDAQDVQAASPAPPPEIRGGRGSLLPLLSLILASVAILLHFYAQIRHESERYFGPLAWLPMSLTDAQLMSYGGEPGTASSSQVAPRLSAIDLELASLRQEVAQSLSDEAATKAELTKLGEAVNQSATNSASLSQSLAGLRELTEQSVADSTKLSADVEALRGAATQAEAKRLELAQAVEAVRQVGAQVSDISGKLDGLGKDLQTAKDQSAEATSRLTSRLEAISSSNDLSLLATRIVLSTAMGSVDSADIDALITRAPLQPALTQPLTELKTLSGADIPTFSALRESFLAREQSAISAVRASREEWWELPVSYARYKLSDFGMSQPPEKDKDQAVTAAVIHKLNSGHLEQALTELKAGSAELQKELSGWTKGAELRLTLDRTILQVVDALLDLEASQKTEPAPG